MAVRVAINGFGRIGRMTYRAIIENGREDVQVVAINDLGNAETNAHLLRHDSVHGKFPADVRVEDNNIVVNDDVIKVYAERNPADLPWGELDVDVVFECTGIFTSKEKASLHLDAGAKKVLVSAPASGADLTVVYGVNDDKLEANHRIVSNASCTTNCLSPVAKALNDTIGIDHGYMTTIHAYTGDQPTLDTYHSDLRRARAAALSMIPTSTGAARAVGLVLPELAGKLDGAAVRVPTPNVSMVDLTFTAKRPTTVEEVNEIVKKASEDGKMGQVLDYNTEPLVSIDFNHCPASSTFDATQTKVMEGTTVHVVAWYDNEWGFSNRMADTAIAMMNAK
ncbi:MAG: type I glyceraldehyde-3-phosphate dehydrogenase [Alphaproteobacteria bacterium]